MKLEDEMENTNDSVRLHVLAQEREHIEYRLQRVFFWHRIGKLKSSFYGEKKEKTRSL